jgi:undecaprenyl diphosphate synthase
MRLKKQSVQEVNIKHIAFIMDGNGRWAKKRGLPREYGHREGAKAFRKVMDYCGELGIEATTFYVFSTENWKRPKNEVDALMTLLNEYLDECKETVMKKDDGIRFVFIGDKSIFADHLRTKMEELEKLTEGKPRIVNLAINYGGRDELVNAFNVLIAEGKRKISEQDISNAIYTKASPPLDMIVRTGGDIRISNFLLWEAAYAELYFTDTLWPDFSKKDIDKAINEFNNRNRRFGGV